MEQKICRQCQSQFTVTDDDIRFLEKVSPEFGGQKYLIPSPTLCPDCRMQQRMAWRNGWKLYKRKCDTTGREIVSMFAPDSKFKIFDREAWFSDSCWNPKDFGREYDFSRPFFEQFFELLHDVPLWHSSAVSNENSDFTNNSIELKNCYLLQESGSSQNCLYGDVYFYSADSADCFWLTSSQRCYGLVYGGHCYQCYFCTRTHDCRDCYFLEDCVGCHNCFACANLQNKEYWIFNKPATKEEYEKIVSDYKFSGRTERENLEKKIQDFLLKQPKRYAKIMSCENCDGDYLFKSRNVHKSYFVDLSENIKYSNVIKKANDFYDVNTSGIDSSIAYSAIDIGGGINNIFFCKDVMENCRNIFYSIMCVQGVADLFGCVGLRKSQYCILNKQYTKEEYERLVPQIISQMQKDGEWGGFFPAEQSVFAYNESQANDYFPLDRDMVEKNGWKWREDNSDVKYNEAFYFPHEDIRKYNPKYNQEAEQEIEKCLAGIIKCTVSDRPFKIIAQELYFYIEHDLPIPNIHPDIRRERRLNKLNSLRLYKRQCMCEGQVSDIKEQVSSGGCIHQGRCANEFETTYSPDRPEKVYCEECYRKSVV